MNEQDQRSAQTAGLEPRNLLTSGETEVRECLVSLRGDGTVHQFRRNTVLRGGSGLQYEVLESAEVAAGAVEQNVVEQSKPRSTDSPLPAQPAAKIPPVATKPSRLGGMFLPLQRRWGTIAATAIAGALAGLVVGLNRLPVYQSVAQLEIEVAQNDDPSGMKDSGPSLQTQLKVLTGQSLMERVAEKLGLQHNDEFIRIGRWNRLIGREGRGGAEQVLERLSRQLTASVSGQSRVVEITARSHDAALSSAMANTLASEYVDLVFTKRSHHARTLSESLSAQLRELRESLERSEQDLEDYTRQAGLTGLSTTNPNGVAEQGLESAQTTLAKAREERILEQARFERASSSPVETLPEVLDDPTLRGYVEKIADLRRRDSELGATLKPAHYKVEEIRAQIATLEKEMAIYRGSVLARIQNQYNSAKNREILAVKAYEVQRDLTAQQASRSVRYATLKSDVETNRQIYESMREKVKQAEIASEVQAPNVHILSAARVPATPSEPVLPFYAASGLIGGLFTGAAVVLARKSPPRIRHAAEINTVLGVPQLGMLPHSNGEDSGELDSAVRQVLANLVLKAPSGGHPRTIAVTSAQPDEGKTMVAYGLAVALAQTSQRVLLLDAHLARPRQHTLFGVANVSGFSSLLEYMGARRTPDLSDATGVPGLFLLTAGLGGAAFAQRLYSPKLPALFETLCRQFDVIVIDAPPVSDLSSRPLIRSAEGGIVVLDGRKNSAARAVEAIQHLAEDGSRVLGTVLNCRTPDRSDVKLSGVGWPLPLHHRLTTGSGTGARS